MKAHLETILIVLFLVLIPASCGVQIDISELQFKTAAQEDSTSPEADLVTRETYSGEELFCTYYFHCLLDEVATGNDPGGCEEGVIADEKVTYGAVKNCRKNQCTDQTQNPGSAGFDAESYMECVLSRCWSEMTDCSVGHGQKSCAEFAEDYYALTEENSGCSHGPVQLCVLESMHEVLPDHKKGVRLFLDCVFNEYPYGVPFASCQAKCALGGL